MRQLNIFFLVLLTIFLACGRSEEGEKKAWESNKSAVRTLKNKYPGFATAIDEQLKLAEKAMSAAKDISNEDDRIQKMAEANRMLSGGWIGDLRAVERDITDLQNLSTKLRGMQMESLDRSAADASVSNANRTITDAQSTLLRGAPGIAAAGPIIKSVKSNLDLAKKDLKAIQSRVDKKKKASEKEKKVADKKAEEEKQKTADWKCNYCGKMNPHDHKECGGCGAARGS